MIAKLVGGFSEVILAIDRLSWLGPLFMRLFFGYFWAELGWAKLHNLHFFIQRFTGWGIPFPAYSATLSASTELVCGILLMIGLATRLAAIPLIINMLVAILAVKLKEVSGLDDLVEMDEALYIVILFWLFISGPGRISIDAWIRRRLIGNPPNP